MMISYAVLYPNLPLRRDCIEIASAHDMGKVQDLSRMLLRGHTVEHLTVVDDGQTKDMFICNLAHVRLDAVDAPGFNHRATVLYRAAWLRANPHTDPDTIGAILGTAVLFDQRVFP